MNDALEKDVKTGLLDLWATPREICLQRAESGGRDDLIPVINRMSDNYEQLTSEESKRLIL